MNWRLAVVLALTFLSLITTFLWHWGNWSMFLGVLIFQLYFIWGNIYPYLFKKTMQGKFGSTLYDGENTDLSVGRFYVFWISVGLYILVLSYSFDKS